ISHDLQVPAPNEPAIDIHRLRDLGRATRGREDGQKPNPLVRLHWSHHQPSKVISRSAITRRQAASMKASGLDATRSRPGLKDLARPRLWRWGAIWHTNSSTDREPKVQGAVRVWR